MAEKKSVGINDLIAKMILLASFIIIIIMIIYWIDRSSQEPEKLFNILLPIISTWVGTLLAFYFGKTNFEAATKSYKQIIDRLTPDVLDDILVKQVMIDKFTMVSIDVTNPMIAALDLKALNTFLDSINKSRLPITDAGKVKCIIHKSVISDELLKETSATTIDGFLKANPIITHFETINEDKKVEDARKLMNEKNYKDLFVVDVNNTVVGWLTDSQIIRYMNNQKL